MRTPRPAAPKRAIERVADMGMHLRDVTRARRAAGADRPDRLVGDHDVAGLAVRHRAGELPRHDSERLAGIALASRSRRCRRSPSARRGAPPPPWRARARRVSPWSVRRSECPTITAVAPASLSISAEISPVCAPEAFGWQSWPPISERGLRCRASASARSASPADRSSRRPGPSGRRRPRRSPPPRRGSRARPFIFQFPAIR